MTDYYRVLADAIVEGPSPRPRSYGGNDEPPLCSQQTDGSCWYELIQIGPGIAPSPYYRLITGPVVFDGDNVTQTQTWESWTAEEIRAWHQQNIEDQRLSADQQQINLQLKPGDTARMVEANSAALARARALGYVPQTVEDLTAFGSTLDLSEVSSVDAAQSQVTQQQAILDTNLTLTGEEQTILTDSVAANSAFVVAGDAQAEPPAIPAEFRTRLGAPAEDYGRIEAYREFVGGWWWLAFKLTTSRQLNPGDYWIAIYDGAGGYLTTPFLTEVSDNEYVADRAAVNLPRSTPDDTFEFTLCWQHITDEMFSRMRLEGGDQYELYEARWLGLGGGIEASGAQTAGTQWVDTGQDVQYVGANLIRINSTAQFSVGSRLKLDGLAEEFEVQDVHSIQDLILTTQPPASAAGDRVFLWS